MDHSNNPNRESFRSNANFRCSLQSNNSPILLDNHFSNTGFSIFEKKYRERPKLHVSQASFYKSYQSNAITTPFNGNSFYYKKNPNDYGYQLNNEKEKKEAIKKIISFLSFKQYPYILTPKILLSPSRKDVIEIWSFLFKIIDPSTEINSQNANEEVPRFFRETGYPVTISKSSMVAPGTGLQWNQHLAAIAWLCELLIYEQEVFPHILDCELSDIDPAVSFPFTKNEKRDNDDRSLVNKDVLTILNSLVAQNYRLFLDRKGTLNNLRSSVLIKIEESISSVRENIDITTREYSQLKKNFEDIQEELKESDKTRERHFALLNETKSLDSMISSAQEASVELDMMINLEEKKNQDKLDKLKSIEEDVKQTKAQIEKQGMSKQEVQLLYQDILKKKEKLQTVIKELKDLMKKEAAMREKKQTKMIEAQETVGKVNKVILDIKERVKKNKMASIDAWNNEIKLFQIADKDFPTIDDFIGVEWKATKSRVKELILDDENSRRTLKNEISSLNTKLEEKQERCRIMQEELILHSREEKVEQQRLKNLESLHEQKYLSVLKDCEEINDQTNGCMEDKNAELQIYQAKLVDMTQELEDLKNKNHKIYHTKLLRYDMALRKIMELKSFIKNTLKEWRVEASNNGMDILNQLKDCMDIVNGIN